MLGEEDAIMEIALEVRANDVESTQETHDFYCVPEDFNRVQESLEQHLGDAQEAKLAWKPQNLMNIDEDKATSLIKMIDTMEDLDDVQAVFTNFDTSNEVMEKLAINDLV